MLKLDSPHLRISISPFFFSLLLADAFSAYRTALTHEEAVHWAWYTQCTCTNTLMRVWCKNTGFAFTKNWEDIFKRTTRLMVRVDTNKQSVLCCLCKAVLVMWALKKNPVLKLLSVVISSLASLDLHRSAVKQGAGTFAEGILKNFTSQVSECRLSGKKDSGELTGEKARRKVVFVWLMKWNLL